MQIIKSISKTIQNLALFIENLTNLGNEAVSGTDPKEEGGLKLAIKETLGMVNDSIKQSRLMANIESQEEMRAFLIEHDLEDKPKQSKK
jgi:hypothetical protein